LKPNVILVLLDGSRVDRLSISEDFLKLQHQGLLFNNVSAAYPYTFSAMNAIFTGLFGKENGVDAYYKMFRLKDSVEFLPEILQKNGYFTSSDLISNKVISSRGFDIHQSHDEYVDDLKERHPNLIKRTFQEAGSKPIFTFLQFSKIHTVTVSEVLKKYEWNDQKFYDQKKTNLENYDKAFQETTKYASIIKKTIEDLGKSNETILIFFSDHGTGIGERFGERNYGVYTFEETIRTFYLFIHPKIRKNQICDKLLSSVQIFPTILDLCEIKNNSNSEFKSFAPFMLDESKKIEDQSFTFTETGGLQGPYPSPMHPNVFCIKNNRYKLIFYKTPNEWKLFDLKEDPDEINNIINTGQPIENELKEKIISWINR